MFSNRLPLLLAVLLALLCWPLRDAHATSCSGGCVQYSTNSSFSGTTASVTLTGVVAGHGIHVWVCNNPVTLTATATVGGSSATAGGTYGAGAGFNCTAFDYPNVGSGSITITETASATCTGCDILAEEWSGDATVSPFDGQNATYTADGTSGTNLPCGSISPATSGDTVETVMFQQNSITNTRPGGYSTTFSAGQWFGGFLTVAASGAQNPTWVSATGAFDNTVMCAAFKQAAGAPVTHNRTLMGVGQ